MKLQTIENGPFRYDPKTGTFWDELGKIPRRQSVKTDEDGRRIMPSPAEDAYHRDLWRRVQRVIENLPVMEDPEGSDEEMMRGIDSRRSPGNKLFDGMY